MGTIVCATRFGHSSRALQAGAIERALTEGKKLIFLFVINPESLGDEADQGYPAAESEMRWYATALLSIAQRRGKRRGVTVETVVRKGDVSREIESVLVAYDADLLIIGRPVQGLEEPPHFDQARIESFAEQISRNTGVPVQIIRPD